MFETLVMFMALPSLLSAGVAILTLQQALA